EAWQQRSDQDLPGPVIRRSFQLESAQGEPPLGTFLNSKYLFSKKDTTIGTASLARPRSTLGRTAFCRSSTPTRPSSSPATMPSTTTYGRPRPPGTHPITSPCAQGAAATRRCSPAI